ncbi:vomeronasal type-2 receptor 26-like [Hyperolius riggenbachi]|uniref:vomeronasal type-2 receptor 26-like n=1 Tax=Hyperolius riggenbachi TaxID=752182 RepID=UPI0035A3D055
MVTAIYEKINIEEYKCILTLIFAVNTINKNPNILPNVTLGYHIFDTCGSPQQNLGYVLHILSGKPVEAPNYSCRRYGEVAGFIGDTSLPTSYVMAQLLSLYRYTQINYQVTDPLLKDRKMFPTLHVITPDERVRYAAIIKTLLHFGWNWVGMVTSNDGSGDVELKELSRMLAQHEICIEYVIQLSRYGATNPGGLGVLWKSKAKLQESSTARPPENSTDNHREALHSRGNIYPRRSSADPVAAFRWAPAEIAEPNWIRSTVQLHHFVTRFDDTEAIGQEIITRRIFEIPSELVLGNVITGKYGKHSTFDVLPLASFRGTTIADEPLNITSEDVNWKGGKMPISRCNDRCSPGSRKTPNGGMYACCYDCIPCSEGEMSNVTDSESCFRCPDEEWPDEQKVRCVPRSYDYLSYENDVLALIFSLATLIFSCMTILTLGIFIYYWDTPIVKANNRTVSIILLTSILLSFLCVFLFLGRPVDITCMLRQVLFGVFFSISVSCVLAKTVTVCIAFKATKPGSYCRKWVTVKISNSLVVICSSVQVMVCVVWLSVSPPYQEYDMHSYSRVMIIQCNEGSVIGFYAVLGYMGFLAAVSFLLAFMVRTLPDSFNEAKYITFSMLVFCSVWIAMIPAYLSTKGKYMVAVEIFAILTSSAGILGCIFLPKCYIMIFQSELNSRKHKFSTT